MPRSTRTFGKPLKTSLAVTLAVLLVAPFPVVAYTITYGTVDNSLATGGYLAIQDNHDLSADASFHTLDGSSTGVLNGSSIINFTITANGSESARLSLLFTSCQIGFSSFKAQLFVGGTQIGGSPSVIAGSSTDFPLFTPPSGVTSGQIVFQYTGTSFSQATATAIAFR
jgi:hypothetical protein